ncbi:C/D box methylation guide ribonucleoprotein complex aNOP56 subunit [Thermococcus thioreducens]|uniref:C/D box methylation guide ribonucleoprotein complex aNOP56 subunit n=1 Tax=Thermococcus thioreducens TaxID=277988 RepID=A0A0Q2ULX4_9EURY|nr:C/D box methylation guide ribonucleoprotein complex aNOP56 subunit [Thermococcus thioreducens]ASJ13124.1 C/D box methylation guide ribonucleoprotein complex aNOP56 subunit [Thermococcus thioreducens]KQH81632.1 C/D box methylation guide ribonucleoprotein complex aNOP56 subunit [Thermococcus thioreducens]SEV80786.1 rRNA biogenesis protein Nop56/Nop58 [Thermococcus thioreducens]
MKAYIAENVRGIYAFDEGGNLIDQRVFSGRPEASLDRLLKGEPSDELISFLDELKGRGYDEFVVEDSELGRKLKELGYNATAEFPNMAGEKLRSSPEEFLGEKWFDEYFSVGVALTRLRIQEQSGARDKMIIQAIESLDDIDKVINLLVSRLREWYSLHFPELDEILPKHQQYVTFVKEIGPRENVSEEKLKSLGLPEGKIEKIMRAAEASMGAPLGKFDADIIMELASEINDLYKLREQIEDYLEMAMDEVAPNLKALVGAKLGARLLSLAGGLKELAMMPASTIQVLGAEKALFRHLRSGAKPPKHGVIFQYPAINRSPWWQRGKIARALAGKLAIAARVDYFSGEYIAEELKQEIEQRIQEIKQKYPNPPKRKAKPEKKKKKKFKGKEKRGKGFGGKKKEKAGRGKKGEKGKKRKKGGKR